FSGTMLYSLIGFVGILFFYVTALKTIPSNSMYKGYVLFPLLFFMPNLHFWSSGVGKDTLLFFCIGMFSYAMLNMAKRLPLLIFSLFLSHLVRPHIALFLVIAFGIGYLVSSNVSKAIRIVLMTVLIGIAVAILPAVMEYAKIEEATVESFEQFSEN